MPRTLRLYGDFIMAINYTGQCVSESVDGGDDDDVVVV